MRTGAGACDIWQWLGHGQSLAHERRMQLLDVAGDLRPAAQIEAGAVRRRGRSEPPAPVCDRLRRFLSRCCRNWFATERRLNVDQWIGGMQYASVSTMPDHLFERWADPERLLLFAPRGATRDALVALFAIGILVITLGYGFLVARQDPGRAIVHKMDQRVQFEGRSLPAQ
jgi:hypothetical protein